MSHENRTTISFTLPLDATKEEVKEVIGCIEDFFGGVSTVADVAGKPATASITTDIASLVNAKTGEIELPWDERIHASTKAKNADGTWRTKRGVDKAEVAKVEAELRAIATAGAGPAASNVVQMPLPSVPPLPGGLPLLPGANAVPSDFSAVVQLIGENMNSTANPTGRLNATWVQQFLTHYQVPNGDVQNLAHNPALATTVLAALRQTLGL